MSKRRSEESDSSNKRMKLTNNFPFSSTDFIRNKIQDGDKSV